MGDNEKHRRDETEIYGIGEGEVGEGGGGRVTKRIKKLDRIVADYILANIGEMEHKFDECPVKREDWERVRAGTKEVRKRGFRGRKFEGYSACFHYGIPQKLWEN